MVENKKEGKFGKIMCSQNGYMFDSFSFIVKLFIPAVYHQIISYARIF